jgi:ribosomal protein L16 Arg81 hydroxylase
MRPQPIDFAALIAPVVPDAFFAEYWEKKPLHIRRADARLYESIVTLADLESVISAPTARYPAVRLAKNGGFYPPEAFTHTFKFGDEAFGGVIDMAIVQAEYRSGATIVLPALHRIWEPLERLCAGLSRFLDHPAHANAYLTPGAATGFTPHYDVHEVFVLQIAGRKHWRVRESKLKLPHRSQVFSPRGYTPSEPVLELDLAPGDLLYLPRGYVHTAATSEGNSAHVTIGVTVFTWIELMSEMLAAAKRHEGFRRALPPGFASRPDVTMALKDGLVDMLGELIKGADYDALIDDFARRVRSGAPKSGSRFKSDVTVIGLDTRLTVTQHGRYKIRASEDAVTLDFNGKTLKLPVQFKPILEQICRHRSFRTGELTSALDDDAKLSFARYLTEEGFLSRQSHTSRAPYGSA